MLRKHRVYCKNNFLNRHLDVQQNEHKDYTCDGKVQTFFEDFSGGPKHPERRNNKKQQGNREENIEVVQWIFCRCFVQMGEFF